MNTEDIVNEGIQDIGKVLLVGVGPGNPDYVTARVAQAITSADVVAGFATVLAVWIN